MPRTPLTPAQQQANREKKYRHKKTELNIGLANNAFGAAAGALGTKVAYNAAKTIKPTETRSGRALLKLGIKPKTAAIGAGTALVGSQLANAAMDAQSGWYFGRERAKLKKPQKPNRSPQPVQKMDTSRFGLGDYYMSPIQRDSGIGYNISKDTPRGDERERARQRRVRRNEILGYGGAIGAGVGGGALVRSTMPKKKMPLGETLQHMALQPSGKKATAMGKPLLRPRGKFFGGAALLAAAPVAAVLNRKAAERGYQRWY